MNAIIIFLIMLKGKWSKSLQLDYMSCGIEPDEDLKIDAGSVDRFPWIGILYYSFEMEEEVDRATTMVILIHRQFVLGSSADISSIPENKLRTNTKVIMGNWNSERDQGRALPGIGVVKYAMHPEYKIKTFNTIAVVKLELAVNSVLIWPICPPTSSHLPHTPIFNIIMEDEKSLKKEIRKMKIVKHYECNEFYKNANLSYRLMRPVLSICAVTASKQSACVWEGGSALASRDPWGRWRLVGFGVRGPGCGAPSRYLDIIAYLTWIEGTFEPRPYLTLRRTAPNNLYLRQHRNPFRGKHAYRYKETNNYGDCETTEVEKLKSLYEETSDFSCDQLQPVTGHYKMTLVQTVNYTCIQISTVSAVNAAQPYLWVTNACPNAPWGSLCYVYNNSTGTIKVSFVFTFSMTLIIKYLGVALDYNKGDTALPNAMQIKALVTKQWLENAV